MFENLNIWEIGMLALLAMFLFGPERLPKLINDGMRMLRNLRKMASNATSDLSRELGTDVKIEDLHPKTFIRKHILSEEDEALLRRPFDDAYQELRSVSDGVNEATKPTATPTPNPPAAPKLPQTYDSDAT
jgi:sec-independent protein translocase protein TatB